MTSGTTRGPIAQQQRPAPRPGASGPPRSGQRSVRGRSGRRWRLRLAGGVVVLSFLAGLGAVLAFDAVVVGRAVQDAENAALAARDRLAEGDVPGARQALRDAREELGVATTRTNRMLWRAAERIPVAGASLATLSAVVEVVDRGSGLGAVAVNATEPLLGPNGELVVQPVDGQLPVEILQAVGEAATGLDPASLKEALERLSSIRGPVPGFVAEGRQRVLAVGDEVVRTLEVVAPVLETVPSFFGTDGRKRFLIGMQNPAELRGTGGLLGFTAVLTTNDGRMRITRPASYHALDRLGATGDGGLEPVEAPSIFASRYARQNAAGFLGNVNVDPDLPTTGPVLLDLVEDRTGLELDGLLLVDPLAVAHILREIGSVEVDPAIAATAPQLPGTVDPDRFAELVMVEHYAAFEARNEERREWLSEVATGAFERIFDAEWDGVAVTRAVIEAAAAGHVTLHLRDEDDQGAFVAADLAGALQPPTTAPDGDVLAMTANNSAGNKMDRHVSHRIEGTITLTGDPRQDEVSRRADLAVTVDNPVTPGAFSLYVEGSFPLSEGALTPRSADRALARTWWSVWAPAAHRIDLRSPDGPRRGSWVIHGHRVADAVLETPSGTAATFQAVIEGMVATPARGLLRHYTLHLRRQPKAIPDRVTLDVVAPEGWRIVTGTTTGGDAAIGVTGVPPTVELVDDGARLVGEVTSDLTLQVGLIRK